MKLYARVEGVLCVWGTEEPDPVLARNDLLDHLVDTLGGDGALAANPVLALIENTNVHQTLCPPTTVDQAQ